MPFAVASKYIKPKNEAKKKKKKIISPWGKNLTKIVQAF